MRKLFDKKRRYDMGEFDRSDRNKETRNMINFKDGSNGALTEKYFSLDFGGHLLYSGKYNSADAYRGKCV